MIALEFRTRLTHAAHAKYLKGKAFYTAAVLSKKGLTLSDKSVVLLWLASAVVAFLVYFYHIQNPAPCEEPVVVEPRLQHLTGEPVELEQ